jgi:hypothetical protein
VNCADCFQYVRLGCRARHVRSTDEIGSKSQYRELVKAMQGNDEFWIFGGFKTQTGMALLSLSEIAQGAEFELLQDAAGMNMRDRIKL